MIQGSMRADVMVYLSLIVVFIAAIALPYPKFGKKDKKGKE